MRYKNFIASLALVLFISLFSITTSFGHVTLLEPQTGDVLEGDSDFTITWEVDETVAPDENWDIRFSRDDGDNWDTVTANLRSTVREFDWKVPNVNTTTGRIEVIQDFPDGEDEGARSGSFTITKATTTKSFSFGCESKIEKWGFGLEKIILEVGDEQSCTLQLTNFDPGVAVEVSTKMRSIGRASVEVFPENGVTDDNGTLEIKVIGLNEGINWVSWAVPDEDGKFKFTKKAYENGTAWGMFVEVK